MNKIPLGEKTAYVDQYDASLLFSINRWPVRSEIGITDPIIFKGWDLWNCYEFSWLNLRGKPELRILEWAVSADSENIVESKSVKLYLNSFHNSRFDNEDEVLKLLNKDLSAAVKAPVSIKMRTLESYQGEPLTGFRGQNIDKYDIEMKEFKLDKSLLELSQGATEVVEKILYSNLLKANCLVTGQPDWGSVQIKYNGLEIDECSILKYLISFRNHNEFAEPAAERIFTDLMNMCKPQNLCVYVRFTRRGGIDINPIRSSQDIALTAIDNSRQARQ